MDNPSDEANDRQGHDIIVIGGSAGGVDALRQLIEMLPDDLPAALFVVLHFPAHAPSVLPRVLNRRTGLSVSHARDGEPIEQGRIYIAPPDRHLLIKRGHVRLSPGPRENSARPAIDPLFRTAATSYGPRVVGVVLSGSLDDGSAGLKLIRMRKGIVICQEPEEALFDDMPRNAIMTGDVDYILPLAGIAEKLVELAYQSVEEVGGVVMDEEVEFDNDIIAMEIGAIEGEDRSGLPSVFACPACGGVLWERDEAGLIRFRCRVGHAYSTDSLLAEQE
ncbi:MAG: chemotaxis protein CheB, partial [Ardenticatenaceae bacterium]